MSSVSSVSTGARRGRPPRLSADLILAAVGRRTDSDWSMAALAADLGVTEPALYYYFPNRQALLQAFGELLLKELELPRCGEQWSPWLRAVTIEFYELVRRHPALADPDVALLFSGASNLRLLDDLLGTLVEHGFSVAEAGSVLAFVMSVASTHARLPDAAAAAEGLSEGLVQMALAESLPHLAGLYRDASLWDARQQFETALDWAIAGVEHSRS